MIQKVFVSPENQGERLDKFIAKQGLGFDLAQKLIRQKRIKINQKNNPAVSSKLESGDVIEIPSDIKFIVRTNRSTKKTIKVNNQKLKTIRDSIIFKDDNLIVLNKTAGLAVQGGSGIKFSIDDALEYLKFEKQERPILVHRLDKDTSGILLIARNKQSAALLTECFRTRTIKKTYLALVKSCPKRKSGTINIPIIKKYQGKNEKVYPDQEIGKEAITNYKLIKNFGLSSLLEVEPITGRTHQIRVHLKEIGSPIIGDRKYSKNETSNRLHLHSLRILINNFFGKKLEIETEMPDFVKEVMASQHQTKKPYKPKGPSKLN